ncbi:proline--tRNA ligase [Paenibacillus cremeus]|uniref:Proline--tRNA ligase n=1 Tax=Paenibacillus cremeus TaxID=2163881 RepID=A0A559K563_9BACL|nr:proline--tRNA ligase [Paenibacillus cremeus]TVY07279.1 proline--tRNA ligase [Paenibacillus cremeus]
MRQSTLLIPTLREAPADADTASHQLMLRAGMIRQVAAGIYTYLPLGWRVLKKIADIVREEMDEAGAQELLMPAMQPAELWQQSGRYSAYGPELIRLHDRHGREFALGPTHEEVITTLVRGEVSSYRQLPLNLYQIQTKFRDERRPRFGLLRGREFLMKDAYSFDADAAGLEIAYRRMYEAYHRIFTRLGLNFRAVEADAGAIGGEGGTHEFMALVDIGEDTVVACSDCGYAANLERAEQGRRGASFSLDSSAASSDKSEIESLHTPDLHSIEELTAALGATANQLIKTLIYKADNGQVCAVCVRGDHEVNEIKVKNHLGVDSVELADAQTVQKVTGAPVGFAGPMGLTIPVLVDHDVAQMPSCITGANKQDYHLAHVRPGRDFTLTQVGDFRNACEHEPCPRCAEGTLHFYRGIELGHVFKLGTKYSAPLGAKYVDRTGQEQVMMMGCYGIGVSRVMTAIVEQHHDANGVIWPASIAPYQVHIVPISVKDEVQWDLAKMIYDRLRQAGIEVLLDDRDERPGVKLKDADLMGSPFRIVVGKGAGEKRIEFKERGTPEAASMTVDEGITCILNAVNKM